MALFLSSFGYDEARRLADRVVELAQGASSVGAFGQALTQELHGKLLREDNGQPATALVRLFITVPLGELPPELQPLGGTHPPETPCLVLVGTDGLEFQWRDRHRSTGHQVIPLADPAAVARAPMIARMMFDLGVAPGLLFNPDPAFLLEADHHPQRVFFVQEALGSPHIPAQEGFIRPYAIRSVVGFGGLPPTGRLSAVLLFCRVPVSREVALQFQFLSMALRRAMGALAERPLFG